MSGSVIDVEKDNSKDEMGSRLKGSATDDVNGGVSASIEVVDVPGSGANSGSKASP